MKQQPKPAAKSKFATPVDIAKGIVRYFPPSHRHARFPTAILPILPICVIIAVAVIMHANIPRRTNLT